MQESQSKICHVFLEYKKITRLKQRWMNYFPFIIIASLMCFQVSTNGAIIGGGVTLLVVLFGIVYTFYSTTFTNCFFNIEQECIYFTIGKRKIVIPFSDISTIEATLEKSSYFSSIYVNIFLKQETEVIKIEFVWYRFKSPKKCYNYFKDAINGSLGDEFIKEVYLD